MVKVDEGTLLLRCQEGSDRLLLPLFMNLEVNVWWNETNSKFAMILEYENPMIFFTFFILYNSKNMEKFWSISLEQKVKHKPPFSEECCITPWDRTLVFCFKVNTCLALENVTNVTQIRCTLLFKYYAGIQSITELKIDRFKGSYYLFINQLFETP